MTKVSVIVPVYNVEQYLTKCLESLVNQTLEDIEIIIVNDGSPDNSQAIIDEYVMRYPNKIKAFKKENGGLSSARNYGILKATGEYIGFVDSDDWVDASMYAKMYEKAKSENCDIVVCDTALVYSNGEQKIIKSFLGYDDSVVNNYIIAPPMASNKLFKKEIFQNVKFKEKIFYEDLELIPSLVNITNKIVFLNEPLYYYFQRSGSIMYQTKINTKLLDIFDVLEILENKLSNYELEVEYLYITHLLRTATLRFLDYEKKDVKAYLDRINNIIKNKFPKWYKNKYFIKSSSKLKLICFLAYYKRYNLLRFIKKIGEKR